MKTYCVYIMSNRARTLYVGVTGNIARRVYEHKNYLVPGFTCKYAVDRLVYVESTEEVGAALAREKQLKGWGRKKKVALIESSNPKWSDLAQSWAGYKDRDDEAQVRKQATESRA